MFVSMLHALRLGLERSLTFRLRRSTRNEFRNAARNAEVVIGTTLGSGGGVWNHMQAIARLSRRRVVVTPPSRLGQALQRSRLARRAFVAELTGDNLRGLELFHSHVEPAAILCAKNLHETGTRWVHTYHTLYFSDQWHNGLSAWQRDANSMLTQVACRAERRISVARWLQRHLQATYEIETEYIPNGFDDRYCRQADPRRFESATGLSRAIVFVGGLSDVKNPKDVLSVAARFPSLSFALLGPGLTPRNIRARLGVALPKNARALGLQSPMACLDAMASCRCFLMTSRSEGMPTALLEAMALARPCVAPDGYGTGEALDDGNAGYTYRSGDMDELASALDRALSDRAIGETARRRALAEYEWRKIVPSIDAVYSDLLDARKHTTPKAIP